MESLWHLTPLSKTALGAALVRAAEDERADRLFDDPYAGAFLSAAPHAFDEVPGRAGDPAAEAAVFEWFSFHTVIRTRFFDDYLLEAGASGCRQVVLLAAGLDTRAFRLAWPAGTRLFELDLPEVFQFKDGVLGDQAAVPRCERIVVPVDLREDWSPRLISAGFDLDGRSAWLAEGLLVYLSVDEAARLLRSVGWLAAPDSLLSIEHGEIADSVRANAGAVPAMAEFTSLWKGGLGEEAVDWLMENGWVVRSVDRSAVAAACGRSGPGEGEGGFLTARRSAR